MQIQRVINKCFDYIEDTTPPRTVLLDSSLTLIEVDTAISHKLIALFYSYVVGYEIL